MACFMAASSLTFADGPNKHQLGMILLSKYTDAVFQDGIPSNLPGNHLPPQPAFGCCILLLSAPKQNGRDI